tara:strand:+ start:774 stop:1217 length:444 start_codon:yes stop_codon:yes gene_type:complete
MADRRIERQEQSIKIGKDTFTMRKVNLDDIKPESVYTFLYEAKYSGTRGKGFPKSMDNMFDANPLITPLKVSSSRIIGLNTHYLSSFIDKGKFIYSFRKGGLSRKMMELMIHEYKLRRIRSSIYLVKNLFVDPTVLSSMPDWKEIRD